MTIDILRDFGLSTKEAQVYLALMEMGKASVAEIAQKAKINRTTTYDILENLANYHLVGRAQGKRKHFAAEAPELLISYLEQKSKEFKDKSEEAKKLLPELKATYNLIPKKPKVKYYDGEDGLVAMYEHSLTSKTEILSWLNTERTADFAPEYFAEYYKRRAKKNIAIKAIVNDVPTSHEIHTRDKAELRKMKIIAKEKMDIVPECYIYDDKVSFMSLREKFGVMIESKDIAEAQRKLYELAWQEADEIEK